MKTYLEFSVDGDISEIKLKDKVFDITSYNYNFIENINYNRYNFVILYNKHDCKKNISSLPFLNKEIYGKFSVFIVDTDNNIKSFTENKLLNLINIKPTNTDDIDDYSSEDFNLSD